MHNQLQAHLASNRRFAKDSPNIEQANAAHFQQVLQQIRATRLNGGLVDAVQIDGIVGHQAITAGNQLQAQLAFA